MKLYKKLTYVLFLLPLIFIMFFDNSAIAGTYTTTNLTNNSSGSNALYPQINDNGQVVWNQWNGSTSGTDIYLYNGATTTHLTNNGYGIYAFYPQINNNGHVVWHQGNGSSSDIYCYDGTTTTNLTNNGGSAFAQSSQINDNGQVVWAQRNTSTSVQDIYLYNGTTTINLTNNTTSGIWPDEPRINNNGQVVWYQRNESTNICDIYLYDGTTTINLTNNSSGTYAYKPQINNSGQVVWYQQNSSTSDVYLYDGATTTNLTNSSSGSYAYYPQINNRGQVIWALYRSNDPMWDVYLYDSATTTNLTNNSSGIYAYEPHINNSGQVIWYQWNESTNICDMYLYDDATTTNLTNNVGYGWPQNPQLNDSGQVVWYQQNSSTFVYDIYLAVPSVVKGTNQPPIVNAGSSQTATAGDVVTFTGSFTDEDQADSHTYSWDFGDGSPSVTDTLNPSHTYADNGTYTVTLTVTDSARNSSSDTLTVTVTNNAPEEPCIGAYTIDNLTNYSSGSYAYYPQINDNGQVVWHQWNGSTSANDVYLYNDTTSMTFNLTNNGSGIYASYPQINNNGHVVWHQGNGAMGDIYYYDGTTTTKLTNIVGNDFAQMPHVNDNGQVVWNLHQWNNSQSTSDIYLYDGATTTNLTNNSSGITASEHQINDRGQVVWTQESSINGSGYRDVYLYDGTTTTNLTNNSSGIYASSPQINNSGQVVWYQQIDVYLYDGATTTNLTNNNGSYTSSYNPQINDGGLVVWNQYQRNSFTYYVDVYLYNGATTTNLTNNSSDIYAYSPQINNRGQVVWYQWDNSTYAYNIYLYDGATTTNLTNNVDYGWLQSPQINDSGQAVWYQDNNIYLAVPCVVKGTNQPPIVNAGSHQTATEGNVVAFTGSYTDVDQTDSHTYSWDFGDGSASVTDTLTPSHTYADNKTYAVTLTVTDSAGNSSSNTLTVTVTNNAPAVNAGADQTVTAGDTVSFSGSYTDAGANDTHTIAWDIDGDGTFDYTGSLTPSHVYLVAGSYTVTLQVTDDDGEPGSDTLTIEVKEPDTVPPSVTILGDNPVTLELGAVYTDAGATALDTVDGDLTASIVTNSTVDTSTAGAYTVTYTVADAAGNTTTASRAVNVVDPLNVDNDNDGYTENQGDCDDTDASVNPGATEVAYNGKDDDCNAATPDDDLDGDGHNVATDCDDNNAAVHPGAQEIAYDGIDQDCNGSDLTDADGDGYLATEAGGNDCNDNDASVHQGATEVPYNGKDDDCNAATPDDDLDGDGYGIANDCNDEDATINPGAAEIANNEIDENCDGEKSYTSEYTQPGTDVVIQPVDTTTGETPVTITFGEVVQGGETTISGTSTPPIAGDETPPRFKMATSTPVYYNLSTTAVFQGTATVCFAYSADVPSGEEAVLKLFHYENSAWVDVTTSLDTVSNVICGEVTSFSPFGIFVENQTPVADAGADQSVSVGNFVTLDGRGSSDADGNAITYSWSITTRPSGSTAELSDAATASPTFTADVAGTYVAQLVVNDGALSSSPDTVTITAKVVEAEVDIKPETINLKEKGKCKAFIELPAPYTGSDVVVSSVECQGAYAIQGRVDDEGRFIATFNVKDLNVETQSRKEEVVFTVSGELKDGAKFQGSDTVKVKNKEKEKEKGKDKDK